MKELKELKLEELSLEQKLGMAYLATVWDEENTDIDYLEKLIKNHALGGVWVVPRDGQNDHIIKRLKEAADYPLLVFTDAEAGFGEYLIGKHNAIGIVDSEEAAYAFGKVVAAHAAKKGYNVVCNPVVDICQGNGPCGGTMRSLGSDKYRVAELAAAEAQGMHDGGCLNIAKHYPGKTGCKIDSHMAETESTYTKEHLLEHNLYPYLELDKKGLLDGLMIGHSRFVNIDPDFPSSLSRHTIQILRDTGFKGLAITDALRMMGIIAKFGQKLGIGYAVGNAAAMAMPFMSSNEHWMGLLRECYDEGVVSDERLNKTVEDVLRMQSKVLSLPTDVKPTEQEIADFERINTDSVIAHVDEGLSTALDRNGNYRFTILTEIGTPEEVMVDTFKGKWYNPAKIAERLQELFPNATTEFLSEFPTTPQNQRYIEQHADRETVFITFYMSAAYAGEERFTPRILSTLHAMQMSNRISTVVHFGNPYLMEDLPHIPRMLIGTGSEKGIDATLNVLGGLCEAKGKMTYDVKLP